MDLYSEKILEHYREPHHKGTLSHPTSRVVEYNPLCGDVVQLDLDIKNGRIHDVKFSGSGCAISQAAISLLLDASIGKSKRAVSSLQPSDVFSLLEVPISKAREKCALLGLTALKKALTIKGALVPPNKKSWQKKHQKR